MAKKSRKKLGPAPGMMVKGGIGPIDDSHAPFKYRAQIGPGAKGREIKLQRNWNCSYLPPAKAKKGKYKGQVMYRQNCEWVGKGERSDKIVQTPKSQKAIRNKIDRKFRKAVDANIRAKVKAGCAKRIKDPQKLKTCVKVTLPAALKRVPIESYHCERTAKTSCKQYR